MNAATTRRSPAPFLLAGIPLVLSALACHAAPERELHSSLERGAADPTRLAADVAWLADDAREGRRAGTAGESAAAEWLAGRMSELGLEPVGEQGYFQSFDVPLEPEEGGRSWVMSLPEANADGTATDATPLSGEQQIIPLFCSAGGGADGTLAFRGYGMVHEEREWNDYPERVDGAVVMIVRGTPAVPADDAEESPAQDPHAAGDISIGARTQAFGNSGSIFNKVMTAKRMGASAVILAQHPSTRGEPLLPFHNGHTAKTSIPAITVSATVAEKLLPGFRERVGLVDQAALAGEGRDTRSLADRGRVALSSDVRRGKGRARNVLGRLSGSKGERTIVLGAHFDHLGHGGSGSLARESWGEIHNGADDNASGTAVVLELARLLSQRSLEDDVLFALWSGEELGLLGSEYWIESPTIDLSSVVCNLNFDMVGRAGEGSLQVLGAGTSTSFAGWLADSGPEAGLDLAVSLSGQGLGGSDHQTFLKRAIPALHFFSGVHTDYHKPTDDVEGFEAEGAARTAELALELVAQIDDQRMLDFVTVESAASDDEREEQGAGWSTWFGSVPSYSWDGPGVKIDGTSAGSPAERAGFLGGDVLLQMGDIVLDDIYDFVYALQVHKPGDVVPVRYLRDEVEETLQLTLGSRALE